ncbi:MAG TPA: penicillin-binding protein 1C [Hyphomicrobiaceae bacterium]|nr:penicillin-binding protein 1C [Hyphomicrobiaceae bacterium]
MASLAVPPLEVANDLSVTVLDRNDRLLRAYPSADGRWRLPVEPAQVDRRYLAMLINFEDKRFQRHRGVDPWAVGRAAWQLARHRRIVSGGSTLTMQVARLLLGEHRRTAAGKLQQALCALNLERRFSKDEILRLYLRLAPFGGNLEGVRAAALAYFGKEPKRLSLAEAALLVALPQAPELRRPDRFPAAAKRARNRVLAHAAASQIVPLEEARRAMADPIPVSRREFPLLAAHLADAEVQQDKGRLVHVLTLEASAQANLERLVEEHADAQPARLSAALIAVDHTTGEVIAQVGSPGYLDARRFGALDMTNAVRSPGSTLKPLIYGLAFEAGLAHPETLIEDRPSRFGAYAPKNFDQDWHGTVSVRMALAQSLNIPAVKVLDALGPGKLYGRLQQVGATPVLPKGAEPTLAIALGGLGLRLSDLAMLYSSLARGGEQVPLRWRRQEASVAPAAAPPPRLLSPVAAWYVTDILRHAPAPANARPGQIAYKTGTSYGFRDAWAVGYDGRHTIAVWVGRPDGTATPGLAGRVAAAPLLFDAFARLSPRRAPLPPAPAGALRLAGSELPPPLKRFRGGEDLASDAYLDPPVQIAFPPDRAELAFDDIDNGAFTVKAQGGALPLLWLLDGVPVESAVGKRDAELALNGRGFFTLTVIDAKGRDDRVIIRIK